VRDAGRIVCNGDLQALRSRHGKGVCAVASARQGGLTLADGPKWPTIDALA
jgi:hypothetical protein